MGNSHPATYAQCAMSRVDISGRVDKYGHVRNDSPDIDYIPGRLGVGAQAERRYSWPNSCIPPLHFRAHDPKYAQIAQCHNRIVSSVVVHDGK